jgi:recombinational DNA repair ATPase RecF
VLSELDQSRREYLFYRIKDKQVILTSCEPSLLSERSDVRRITVANGTYTQEGDI